MRSVACCAASSGECCAVSSAACFAGTTWACSFSGQNAVCSAGKSVDYSAERSAECSVGQSVAARICAATDESVPADSGGWAPAARPSGGSMRAATGAKPMGANSAVSWSGRAGLPAGPTRAAPVGRTEWIVGSSCFLVARCRVARTARRIPRGGVRSRLLWRWVCGNLVRSSETERARL